MPQPRGKQKVEAAAPVTAPKLSAAPVSDQLDNAFFAAIEEDLAEISHRGPRPVIAAVNMPVPVQSSVQMLQMADPIHAQMSDARKSIRAMWIGMALLIIAVIGGVVWTTVRMERADQLIASLLAQLDNERTLVATYKHETTRLQASLSDSKAQVSKLKANQAVAQAPKKQAKVVVTSGR